MTQAQVLKVFENYKFKNNEVINYITLNNEVNSKTLSDPSNLIASAVKGKDTKFLEKLLKSMFNVKGDLLYDKVEKHYVIIEKVNNTAHISKVTINIIKNDIVISVDNNKKRIVFQLPEVINNFNSIKNDIIEELKTINNKDELKKFIDNLIKVDF